MTENSIAQLSADPDNHNQLGNGTAEKMKSNSSDGDALETGAKSNTSKAEQAAAGAHSSPKKRRKVNHGKNSFVVMFLARMRVVGYCALVLFRLSKLETMLTGIVTPAACVYCRRSVSCASFIWGL